MDLQQVKEANPIEDLINDTESLRGRGRWMRGTSHDSLVVDTEKQVYNWNSRGEWGDVIAWVMTRNKWDFKRAVEYLCKRGGLEPPRWGERDEQVALAARARQDAFTVACRHWVKCLRAAPAAIEYARCRGWTNDTIREAGLAYVDGDTKSLRGELQMHNVDLNSPAAKAVLKAPQGFLVYPHVYQGRVQYFACRSIAGKRHWNPPADLGGKRQVYFNHEYAPMSSTVVVVEGQADAVTLAQWGFAAVALAGCYATPDLLRLLGRHDNIVLGLDNDDAGNTNTAKIANALGPMTRIVRWPEADANAWLQSGADATAAAEKLSIAPTWVELAARRVGQASELEREALLRNAFNLIARADDFSVQTLRPRLVDAMDIQIRQFNALLKSARGEREDAEGDEEDGPDIIIEIPGGYISDHLLEMIVVPPENGSANSPQAQWKTQFACRFPDGQIRIIEHLEIDGVRFDPVTPSSRVLTEGVVQFPSALGGSRSLRELVRMIRETIHRYVDVDVFYESIATYYVLFSWLYDSFNTVPYLRMLGDAGTGKSRFIQIVGAMCYRPTFVTGAATVSPIFRILDAYGGTLVLDEGDYRNSDEAADIIKILNTGYQKVQGVVLRSGDKNSGFEPEVYRVFGPKVIATRKRFKDWALESRCLTYEAGGPTTRADIPIDLPRDFWVREAVHVRNALLRYRLENWKPEIELDYSRIETSVEPRLNQVTVALQTLIDDPDLSEELRSFIQRYNRQLIVERGMTLTAKVLEAAVGLGQIERDNEDTTPTLTIGHITEATNVLIDAENAGDSDDEGRADKALKPHKVGHIVRKQLHLNTERGGSEVGRAYVIVWDQDRIDALRKRYGLDDDWLSEVTKTLMRFMYAPDDEVPPEADIGDLF